MAQSDRRFGVKYIPRRSLRRIRQDIGVIRDVASTNIPQPKQLEPAQLKKGSHQTYFSIKSSLIPREGSRSTRPYDLTSFHPDASSSSLSSTSMTPLFLLPREYSGLMTCAPRTFRNRWPDGAFSSRKLSTCAGHTHFLGLGGCAAGVSRQSRCHHRGHAEHGRMSLSGAAALWQP